MIPENFEEQSALTQKQRLLLIDDDASVLASLKLLFKDDYETFEASTVADGLRLFSQVHPSVVILDLRLPDRSGIDALREIREIDPKAAVVILTGYSTRIAAEETLRLGALDYVNKPYVASDLKIRIAKLALSRLLLQPNSSASAAMEKVITEGVWGLRELQNASAAFLHDVASPLSSLMTGADLLSSKLDEGTEIEASDIAPIVATLSDSVRYLHALVEQWRTFSDLQAMMKEECDVQEAVDLAVSQVMEMLSSTRVVFQIEFHQKRCRVFGNRFALARVLINLLKNAYEAVSPLHGRIDLVVTVIGDNLQIVVADNGPGIKSPQLAEIFMPRFTTKSNGRGLGLFISKKIVEALDGKITAQSPGRLLGADFIISLPLA